MANNRITLPPGKRFRIADFDPDHTGKYDKKRARKATEELQERLHELQERLYADCSRSLLVVLQAMDTAGKDGTIKHAMGSFNPQGVHVRPFKVPSSEELAHDFLWRAHKVAPAKGMIGIFNRSHYEDVLVVRVKKLVPRKVWQERYDHINSFERLLADNGTRIVKIFLNISPEEQAERLRERQATPEKQWKFNPGDLEDRTLWPRFMAAYEDALTRCNAAHAPWYVVPANRKWYRNLVVSEILIEALESMRLRFPKPVDDVASYEIPEVTP
jgi:PPK2 family polyphosphate:nucleotide phosphotransferase